MDKKQFVYNLFAIFVLIGLALVITYFATPIRQTITFSQKMVAGASTENIPLEVKLPKDLSKDVAAQTDSFKEKALQIEVGEILTFLGRTGKIIQDIKSIPDTIEKTTKQFTQ